MYILHIAESRKCIVYLIQISECTVHIVQSVQGTKCGVYRFHCSEFIVYIVNRVQCTHWIVFSVQISQCTLYIVYNVSVYNEKDAIPYYLNHLLQAIYSALLYVWEKRERKNICQSDSEKFRHVQIIYLQCEKIWFLLCHDKCWGWEGWPEQMIPLNLCWLFEVSCYICNKNINLIIWFIHYHSCFTGSGLLSRFIHLNWFLTPCPPLLIPGILAVA